jgi:hypothetical protein
MALLLAHGKDALAMNGAPIDAWNKLNISAIGT